MEEKNKLIYKELHLHYKNKNAEKILIILQFKTKM